MAKRSQMTGGKQVASTFRRASGGFLTPISAAMRTALAPMLAAAKRNAPVDDGTLKRSLAIKKDGRSAKTRPRYVVGPSTDAVGPDGSRPVKYAHVTEFGKVDGSVVGTRWLTRSFEETADEVLHKLALQTGPEIERYMARQAAKQGQT